LLRQFIQTGNKETTRDQRFVATLESLIELIVGCACKRPKISKAPAQGISLNAQRKHGFCDLCGNLTEFSAFIALVSDNQVNEELENRKKLQLSHQYCAEHRPKLANGEWNSAYRQARRSKSLFDLELIRLKRQCAKPATPQSQSGDYVVDEYIFHYVIGQTLLPSDEAEIRRQARLMADHLPARQKKILALLAQGLNQSEIAKRLGSTRQAVSKSLASIPPIFHLTQQKKRLTR
jgi:DNA-binding CsgD family transcriptional regulator